MAITYKSVIVKAIADFNAIQNEIHAHDSTVAATATRPVATTELATLVKDKLQKLASGTATLATANISSTPETINGGKYYTTNTASTSSIKFATEVAIPEATFGIDTTDTSKIKVVTAGYVPVGFEAGSISPAEGIALSAIDAVADADGLNSHSLTVSEVSISNKKYYSVSGSISANVSVEKNGYFTGVDNLVDTNATFGFINAGELVVNYDNPEGNAFVLSATKTASVKSTGGIATGVVTAVADSSSSIDTASYERIEIELGASGSKNASVTATAGYFGSDTTNSQIALNIDETKVSKFIGIRKATFSNLSNVSATGVTVATTASDGKYSITANGLKATAAATNSGYTTTTGELSATSGIVVGSIDAGSVSSSAHLSSATLRVSGGGTEILEDRAPTGTLGEDYFTISVDISATSSIDLTPGYIYSKGAEEGFSLDGQATKYISAAQFQFVRDDNTKDDDGNPLTFIQCTKSGYISTGSLRILGKDGSIITDFTNTGVSNAENIDWAVVKANLTSTNSIVSSGTAVPNGAYEITISKGTVDPGYISATTGQGSVELNNKYWVAKTTAGAEITSLGATVAFNGDAVAVDATKSSGFVITATPTASAKATGVVSSAGYVTSTDVTTTGDDAITETGTPNQIYIKAAEFKESNTTSDVVVTTTSSTLTNGASMSGNAVVYSMTDSTASNYVLVNATGYNKAEVKTAGHTAAAGTIINSTQRSGQAKIKATQGNDTSRASNMTGSSIEATNTFTPTSFGDDTVNKDVVPTTGTYQFKVSGGSIEDSNIKDTYMVGNYKTRINEVSMNVVLPADATGSNVDNYVEQLYARMLGYSYTQLSADSTN